MDSNVMLHETGKRRKTCIIIGRGAIAALAHLLLRHEVFRRHYQIRLCQSAGTGNFRADFARLSPLLDDASILIYQPPIWAPWADDGEIYPQLMQAGSSKTLRLSVPYVVFNPLWPHHHNEAQRAAAVAAQFDDRSLLFSYSDAHVARMVAEGATPQEIVDRYRAMDIPATLDLTRLGDNVIAQQRPKEDETDVKVLDFILETYRGERLFYCFNHVSNLLNLHIANQILKKIDLKSLSYDVLEQTCLLQPPEIPVHPSIVKYFRLEVDDAEYAISSRALPEIYL